MCIYVLIITRIKKNLFFDINKKQHGVCFSPRRFSAPWFLLHKRYHGFDLSQSIWNKYVLVTVVSRKGPTLKSQWQNFPNYRQRERMCSRGGEEGCSTIKCLLSRWAFPCSCEMYLEKTKITRLFFFLRSHHFTALVQMC